MINSKIICGGSWFNEAQFLRSAYRFNVSPEARGVLLGFRLIRMRSEQCESVEEGISSKIRLSKKQQEEFLKPAECALISDEKNTTQDLNKFQKVRLETSQNELIQNLNHVKNADQKNISTDTMKIIKNLLRSIFFVESVTSQDIKNVETGDAVRENSKSASFAKNNSSQTEIIIKLRVADQYAPVNLEDGHLKKDGDNVSLVTFTLDPSEHETREAKIEAILKKLDGIKTEISELSKG